VNVLSRTFGRRTLTDRLEEIKRERDHTIIEFGAPFMLFRKEHLDWLITALEEERQLVERLRALVDYRTHQYEKLDELREFQAKEITTLKADALQLREALEFVRRHLEGKLHADFQIIDGIMHETGKALALDL